jgi:hypothetical protein
MADDGNVLLRAQIFAGSRAGSAVLCQGPETRYRPGWFPRLARQFVRNEDDPSQGYATREEAVKAAKRFKVACIEFVNGTRQKAPGDTP